MSQCNLHQHSENSFLDGYARMSQIARRAAELGSSAVAVTDHNEVSGHWTFQKACRAEGIKPILGIEADWIDHWPLDAKGYPKTDVRSHICLLAANQTGLKNIWTMSSVAYKDYYYYKPLLPLSAMREFSEGVWASDGCALTSVANHFFDDRWDEAYKIYGRLQDIFRDRFYVELHTWQYLNPNTTDKQQWNAKLRKLNHAKVQMARDIGARIVIVNDSHHAYPQDWERKDLVWKFSTGGGDKSGETVLPRGVPVDEHGQKADHLMGGDPDGEEDSVWMWMRLHGIGDDVIAEAIKNSQEIADQCEAEVVPTLGMPSRSRGDQDDFQSLVQAVEKASRYKVDSSQTALYEERAVEELKLIHEKGFAGYFLVVQDYVEAASTGRWAHYTGHHEHHEPMLVGPGRGSAGGSLVAWLLGITSIDPIHYGLLFERFLAPGRKDLPDIDCDFPQSLRPEMKKYLERTYDADHVCSIGTLSRSSVKGMLKDLGRAYDVPIRETDKIAQILVAEEPNVDDGSTDWQTVVTDNKEKLSGIYKAHPGSVRMMEMFPEMVGIIRQSGVHPSGVVVSDRRLFGNIPLRIKKESKESGGSILVTQFDMGECVAGDTLVAGVPVRNLVNNPPATLRSLDETTGEMVDNSVVRVIHRGVRKLVRVKLVGGASLRCTSDHLVFTRRGWVQAGDLTPDDEVMVDV